jgi:thioredoxin 1
MRIGELASRAGTSARSVRYYEQQGLLLVRRRANGYRDYDEADLLLVREIRSLLVNGFDLDEIRPFVDCLHAGIEARGAHHRRRGANGGGGMTSNTSNTSVAEVTEATFDSVVLQSRLPVLVDFWAEWCGPCKWLSPVVEEIAREQAGKLLVVKVHADDNPGLSRRYGAMSLPSLLLFHGGAERTRIVGAMPRRRLLAELGRFLPGA